MKHVGDVSAAPHPKRLKTAAAETTSGPGLLETPAWPNAGAPDPKPGPVDDQGSGDASDGPSPQEDVCPHCGEPVEPGDSFPPCEECGEPGGCGEEGCPNRGGTCWGCGLFYCDACGGFVICEECWGMFCQECGPTYPREGGGRMCSGCAPQYMRGKPPGAICTPCGSLRRGGVECQGCGSGVCENCPHYECEERADGYCEACNETRTCEVCERSLCEDCRCDCEGGGGDDDE